MRVLRHALRGQGSRRDDSPVANLAYPPNDQLLLDGFPVQLLHPPRGLVVGQRRDLVQHGLGVLVPRLEALQVEHRQAAQLPDLDRRRRGDDAVHGGGQHRQLERPGIDLPGDVDVVRVTRPA